jgi:hypothetical protein
MRWGWDGGHEGLPVEVERAEIGLFLLRAKSSHLRLPKAPCASIQVMAELRTKAGWRSHLKEMEDAHPGQPLMIAFNGKRHLRFWPPGIVYDAPPSTLDPRR